MDLDVAKALIETAKHVQSVYINNVWTTMGALLVALGWLLTSKEAREHLSNNKELCIYSIVVTSLIFVIHAAVLIQASYESYEISGWFARCEKYMVVISVYQIPWYWPVLSLTINGLIAWLLLHTLFTLRSAGLHKQSTGN